MRRAQAAMEFLLTYGWAVFVILLVVAILIVLFPKDTGRWHRSNHCLPPTGFACPEFKVEGTNASFIMYNTGGSDLAFVNVTLYSPQLPSGCTPATHEIVDVRNQAQVLGPDVGGILSYNCSDLSSLTHLYGELRFTWQKAGDRLPKSDVGTVRINFD